MVDGAGGLTVVVENDKDDDVDEAGAAAEVGMGDGGRVPIAESVGKESGGRTVIDDCWSVA